MSDCPDRIVSYLEAELAARTTSQIAAGLGEPAARVRNYVSRLAREGRVIRVDFAGAKCPACQQRLSRALTVYTVARPGWGAAAQEDARAELLQPPEDGVWIVATPGTLSGAPRIAGSRIGVQEVVAAGSVEAARELWPHLPAEAIRAAHDYAGAKPFNAAGWRVSR